MIRAIFSGGGLCLDLGLLLLRAVDRKIEYSVRIVGTLNDEQHWLVSV